VIAYFDSSVVVRIVLGQQGQLADWRSMVSVVGSRLVEVECLRTIDRLNVEGRLTTDDTVIRREAIYRMLDRMELVELTSTVLQRASQPMPAPLGTLDAIHLASAMLWKEVKDNDILMATHDRALALAARASGLRVAGV
jgi:predicted nucleic acid-binding protein